MSLKINRQRDESFNNKPVLSQTGKNIIVGGCAAIIVLAVIMIASSTSGREKLRYRQAVASAVERSMTVCQNSLTELECGSTVENTINSYIVRIRKEKRPLKKADTAKEMITYLLGFAGDNVSVQDDLKGAQNRIMTAVKEYQVKYGSKKM